MLTHQEYETEYEQIFKEVNENRGNLPPANIIIAGITGSGKSTLINSVFGEELAKTGTGGAVTDHIQFYKKDGVPVRIWDTVGLELDRNVTMTTIQNIRQIISDKTENKNDKFDRIHAIWYCIQATGDRFQDEEVKFIYELKKLGVPFIIVLTKCFSKKKNEAFEREAQGILREHDLDIPIVKVLAQPWEVDFDDETREIPSKGLEELINLTADKLPDFICESFIAAQKVEKEIKRRQAEEVIIRYCKAAKKSIGMKIPIFNVFQVKDKKKGIVALFKEIGMLYNTQLDDDMIDHIYDASIGEWKGKAAILLNPFPNKTYNMAQAFFNKKVIGQPGFENDDLEFTKFQMAAMLITWAGYSWIEAIEKHWDELIKAQTKQARDQTIKKMVEALKQYMQPKQVEK